MLSSRALFEAAGEYVPRQTRGSVLLDAVRVGFPLYADGFAAEKGFPLPRYLRRAFEDFQMCGDLSHGYAHVTCDACDYERSVPYSCKRRGWCPSCMTRRMLEKGAHITNAVFGETAARHWDLSMPAPLRQHAMYDRSLLAFTQRVHVQMIFRYLKRQAKRILKLRSVNDAYPGAVTSIQCCSCDLGVNVHYHSLVTDGVFVLDADGRPVFHQLPPPTDEDVADIAWQTCLRILAFLAKRGDFELVDQNDAERSVTGNLALGATPTTRKVVFHAGAGRSEEDDGRSAHRPAGTTFSLYAKQAAGKGNRKMLQQLAEYILHPPFADNQLEQRPDGRIALRLKRPNRWGAWEVLFQPRDLVAKLAAITPKPWLNTIRFHGVYAANAKLRGAVVPAARQSPRIGGTDRNLSDDHREKWANLLQRVYAVDVLKCPQCGGRLRVEVRGPAITAAARAAYDTALRHIAGKAGPPANQVH